MDFRQLLIEAKRGNHEAFDILFEMYRPLLHKNSYIYGVFDEDLWQEQCFRFLVVIKEFSMDL